MFDVKTKKEHGGYYLSITHNGYQWTSIPMKNIDEIQQVIVCLKNRILEENFNDTKPMVPQKDEKVQT